MPVILHVLVVGFHHRKGCQVDYCFPPLPDSSDENDPDSSNTAEAKENPSNESGQQSQGDEGVQVSRGNGSQSRNGNVGGDSPVELPEEWINLPTMALPDGAHNVDKDTVYFHLPALNSVGTGTVYGISCFRQIGSDSLVVKSDDVTRCTVQKSVCVLSTVPLYGLIKAKLELITEAYFNERNFERVEVLAEMYDSLTATIKEDLIDNQSFLGLSTRDLVLRYKQKIVIIFKLILLERKVLFHLFPVEKLCQSILSFVSLYPGMIEHGLSECAIYVPKSHYAVNLEQSVVSADDIDGDFFDKRPSTGFDGTEQAVGQDDSPNDTGGNCHPVESSGCSIQSGSENPETIRPDSAAMPEAVGSDPRGAVEEALKTDFWNNRSTLTTPAAAGSLDGGAPAPVSTAKSDSASTDVNATLDPMASTGTPATAMTGREQVPNSIPASGSGSGNSVSGSNDTGDASLAGLTEAPQDTLESSTGICKRCPGTGSGTVQRPASMGPDGFDDCATPAVEETIGGTDRWAPLGLINSKSLFSSSYALISSWRQKVGNSISTLGTPMQENDGSGPGLGVAQKSISAPQLAGVVSSDPKDFSPAQKEEILKNYSSLETDEWGFPLSIFTKGSLCHPYLSLAHIDWLRSASLRAYLFGATNDLFRQRRSLLDAAVYEHEGNIQIDIFDPELRRQLVLTTADLRFADYLSKNVSEATGNVFVDDTAPMDASQDYHPPSPTQWEGGDDWVRLQFRAYLLSLMATAKTDDADSCEDFNSNFMKSWRTTHNYRIWACSHLPRLNDTVPGHPFRGQLSMTDVKLKVTNSMQNSDSGRKLNQAVNQAEKYVSQTGKVVEGAFSHAKSSLTSWWSGNGNANAVA